MPRETDPPPSPEPLASAVLDAHTHLDAMAQRAGVAADDDFVTAELAASRAVGVTAAVTVGDTVASSRWCAGVAARHPGLYAAVAVHPTEVGDLDDDGYAELERLAGLPGVVAVGETGLDYYWDRTAPALQHEHFRRHIELAKRTRLPLMIHDRDAHADVLRILREEGAPEHVVFHAFSGDAAMARECVAAGYVLSFPGVVTFRNAPALREAAAVTPAEHVLVETDAPFLTPHPFRGRPNAPRLLPLTLRELARAGGHDVGDLAAATRRTAHRVFGIRVPDTPDT
ncbi:TatD DNase family protein [Jatrophihabitans endophyticus]|uniref:TatD DNase family protein n=1 Tax=Jatrophihabitans endophyticus TaxID=1206085 RepID=A0A1M5U2G9_9ACTN|nr:TatD family hydrolase [Jatrophihabitans endophyticus]SHH57227.1 TatD DNase family protein [Jatrophihabitans endophyticus]